MRTAAFFPPRDHANFAALGLAALEQGEAWRVASDQVVSPTYMPDLAQASLDLLIDGERGIWHLTNEAALSWSEMAHRIAEAAGVARCNIVPTPANRLGQTARRPAYSALRSVLGRPLP